MIENKVETNIILVNITKSKITPETFLLQLKEHDILAGTFGPNTIRFVTNNSISKISIDKVLLASRKILSS